MPRVVIEASDHASAGAIDLLAITRLAPKQVVTAVRDGAGNLKVIAWEVGGDGSLTRRGDASAGGISRLAITDWPEGPGVVTAVRTAEGALKIIAWSIDASGNVARRGDAEAGAVKELAVSSPAGLAGVVSPVVNGSGELEVITWSLSSSGGLTRAGTGSGGACTTVAATALTKTATAARVAVGVRAADGNLKIIAWAIPTDQPTAIGRIGEISAGAVTEVALTAAGDTPNADLISCSRGADGDLALIGWSIAADGALSRGAKATGGAASDVSVTTWKPDIHTYIVGAMRGEGGQLKLIVWRNGADLVRHGEIVSDTATRIRTTLWSGGVVTAYRDGSGNLRLDSWRLRPAGMKLLRAVWPPPSAPVFRADAAKQLTDDLLRLRPGAQRSHGEQIAIQPAPKKGVDSGDG